ncbi:MAG: phage terminase large subunit [Sulfitobacter sp.]|nr:phage terminase large subunit [Sulfitobacter sp.]
MASVAVAPKRRPALWDFRNFLFRAWQVLGLPEPTRLQYDLAHHMQHGPDRLVALCFRGFGKSWMATTKNNHDLYLDHEEKCLQISAAKKKADDSTRFMLNLIEKMPELHRLRPDPRIGNRCSNVEFDVCGCLPAHQPSVRSLGILSNSLWGSRAGKICADDIETKENSQTITQHEKVRDRARELGGAILRSAQEVEHPKVLVLGTPQLEESMYFESFEQAGYTVMIYPARYPTSQQVEAYGGRLAKILADDLAKDPSLVGQPTEPTRFGEKELLLREAEYGRHGFLLQFMLMPSLADEDRYPLRLSDLLVMDLDHEVGPEKAVWSSLADYRIGDLPRVGFERDWYHRPADIYGKNAPYQQSVMAIDPSAGGSDETAYVVLKALNSQIFLIDVGGFRRGDAEGTMQELARIAKKFDVNMIKVEQNMGGGVWSKLLIPHLHKIHRECGVEDVHVTGRKEIRIKDTLGPVMASHRLVINKSAIQKDYDSTQRYPKGSLSYQLMYQMSRLTEVPKCLEHDDRLDALCLGVAHFQDTMARDYRHEMKAREEEEMEQFLEDWKERNLGLDFGRSPKQATWMEI